MALSFCPPSSIPPNASSLIASSKASLITSRTLAPLTKPPPPPIPGPSHHPLIGSFHPTKKNFKRVAHPAPLPLPPLPPSASSSSTAVDVVAPPVAKKRKLAAVSNSSSRAGTPSSLRRSSPPRGRSSNAPPDSDDEAEWNKLRTLGARTRSSTPKETGPAFGTYDEHTQSRINKTDSNRQDVRVGIREDGRVPGIINSEDVVKPIIHKYKRYFSNPDDPNDKSFDPDPTCYPVVELEYPNWEAKDRFVLLSPIDKDHYHPIIELMDAIHTIVSCYLLPAQQPVFGTLPDKYAAIVANVPPDTPASPASTSPTTLSPLNPSHHHATSLVDFSAYPPIRTCGQDALRNLEKAYHTANGPAFVHAINLINGLLRQAKEKIMENVRFGWQGVPPQVTKVILEETYQRTVGPNVKELGKYPPFSDLVYGELNMPFVQDILFRTGIRANNTFVDLGCGVGNCLIQAALQTGCTANGIELNPPPATLGKSQVEQYKKRVRLWGLSTGPVTLLEGNFCERPEVREWLSKADLVLVNNWAFSAELNEKLSLMFLDLREGARIVSMKPFRRSDFRLTERTASSPEAIFRVEEVAFRRGTVSWMAEGGVYYLHCVDRGPLRLYLERENQMQMESMQQHQIAPRRKRKEKERDADGWN